MGGDGWGRPGTAGDGRGRPGTAGDRRGPRVTGGDRGVKEWHLLKEVVPREKFHLMNSTWLWALGFSNLTHRFLQPPPSVETAEQRTRRLERQRTEAAASAAEMDELRAACAAAASAMDVDPGPPTAAPRRSRRSPTRTRWS